MAAPGSIASSSSADGGSAYVTAVASSSLPVSDEVFLSIEKSREQGWSEVADHVLEGVARSSSRGLSVEDERLWEELKKEAPRIFVDEVRGLKLGQVIAEGGQAEIREASCDGVEFPLVAKVFKMEGFSLVDLHRHWPRGKMPCSGSEGRRGAKHCSASTVGGLVFDPLRRSKHRSAIISLGGGFVFKPLRDLNSLKTSSAGGLAFDPSTHELNWISDYLCFVRKALFLEDGSFAFLSERYLYDLRKLINLRLGDNNGLGPPFPYEDVGIIMYSIASGMKRLHEKGILHRDLKAANVLCSEVGTYLVADYESSMLVQGTGFWRAPEVLGDLQKNSTDRNTEIWTEKVDVYSFAMTCYEVMTGATPFPGYAKSDWQKVIDGERPHLPDYVDPKLGELVERCWHKEPSERPSFDAIVRSLSEFEGKLLSKVRTNKNFQERALKIVFGVSFDVIVHSLSEFQGKTLRGTVSYLDLLERDNFRSSMECMSHVFQ